MPGGVYAALSGLKAQSERLDRLSMDIANSSTSGYKGERAATEVAERDSFAATLNAAVDVIAAPPWSDFRTGELAPTGRDLDLAIEGEGFFSVLTPGGVRYTRSGHFTRRLDGTVTASDGSPLLGEDGPIRLPPGDLRIGQDGSFSVGKTTVGRPVVTTFADPSLLRRGDGVRFYAPDGVTGTPDGDALIQSGMLEQSNVQLSERMAQIAEASRGFEALTRGISILMNDVEGRAITELGRR